MVKFFFTPPPLSPLVPKIFSAEIFLDLPPKGYQSKALGEICSFMRSIAPFDKYFLIHKPKSLFGMKKIFFQKFSKFFIFF